MEKTFFQWEAFSEEHGNMSFPAEAIEEIFLLDVEKNSIWLSKKLARLLYFGKKEMRSEISIEELERFFVEGGRENFHQELGRLIAGKVNHVANHVAVVVKDNCLSAMCYVFALQSERYLLGFLSIDYEPIQEYEQQLESIIRRMQHTQDVNELILEGAVDYIYQYDLVNNTCTVSSKTLEILPLDSTVVRDANSRMLELIVPEDRQKYLDSMTAFLTGQSDFHRVKYRMRTRNGDIIWILSQGKGLRDENGVPTMLAGSMVDITEQRKKEEKINQILYYDALTGLKNSRCFEKEFKKHLEREGVRGSLVSVNLRRFKLFNELFGRDFANRVLQETAHMLKLYFPSAYAIYRFEGDEFMLHLPEYHHEDIMARLLPLQNSLKNVREMDGHTFYLNLYAAVVIYPENGATVEELLMHANQCLHRMSGQETESISFFTGEMGDDVARRYLLENELRKDIQNNFEHFRVVYQPIVKVKNGKSRWIGAEALLRYSNPDMPDIGQMEMIHTLEYSGLILTVGRWVISKAARECSKWNRAGCDAVVHVNMAAQQIADAGLVSYIKEQCEQAGLAASHLVVELTETSLVNNFSVAAQMCRALRKLGVGVALDDFGTGYSGFTYLRNFPITKIKVDREYARDIPNNHYNQVIVNFMHNLSENMKVDLCVEGVETKEELEILQNMGVSIIQGFYFERPMEAELIRNEFFRFAAVERE